MADGPVLVTRPARAASVPNAGPPGLARTAGRGPWPALPDEPAWSGNLAGGPDPGTGGAGAVRDGWADAADRWPALPDDGPLWTVPGAALDAARLARLDREQAGG
ncbi:hypothetical protein ACQEUX_06710 [Micromonospora sp. CA-259024]|uniref:hypothetical protein n=1 Tax=Micromonospora sp. CA-259024 TaxID=3239965 RepID=UPI003D8CD097